MQIKSFEASVHPVLELYHVIPGPIPILDFPVHKAMTKQIQDEDDKVFAKFTKAHPDLKMVRGSGNILDKIEKKRKVSTLLRFRLATISDERFVVGHQFSFDSNFTDRGSET